MKEYFKAVGLEESTIRHVKKLTKNNKTRPSNMIQVILETNENKVDLMKRIKHKQIENFESVIVREDRTFAQQAEFSKLNKEKTEKNEALKDLNELNQPFRYVIHRYSGTVRCIDELESIKQKRYIFKEPTAEQKEKIRFSKDKSTEQNRLQPLDQEIDAHSTSQISTVALSTEQNRLQPLDQEIEAHLKN